MRRAVAAGLLAAGLGAAAPPATAEVAWRLEQPPPPEGVDRPMPLGGVGDLAFRSPSRGLLITGGNGPSLPPGLFTYDGAGWKRLSTVCGGAATNARIAWAGQDEFWTVSDPADARPGFATGTSLCRFAGGRVVASFAQPDDSPEPYAPMTAAACDGPASCWFGGEAAATPTGSRRGAFHLRWDGQAVSTVYGPQGRAVSGLAAIPGGFFESTHLGPVPDNPDRTATLRDPEPEPLLLHRLIGVQVFSDPWTPEPEEDVPADGTELLAADSGGGLPWVVGGGAASGRPAEEAPNVQRPPVAAVLRDGGFAQVPIRDDAFGGDERFVDVAGVPGTDEAWVAVAPYSAPLDPAQQLAKVARLRADGTVLETHTLPAGGAPRGAAARIACPAPDDCWMVTVSGWLFHLSGGAPRPVDSDPAFGAVITQRPRDARSPQPLPDAPPEDDSNRFAPPPPPPPEPAAEEKTAAPRQLRPLLVKVRSKLVRRRVLVLSFRQTRRGRVRLIALRKGKVVARTRLVSFKPGRHQLRLRLDPRRWPTKLRFKLVETDPRLRRPEAPSGGSGGDDDLTVTTPPPGAGTD